MGTNIDANETSASLPAGPPRPPQPVFTNHRLRFCPAATSNASVLTFQSLRTRNFRKLCHCRAYSCQEDVCYQPREVPTDGYHHLG